MKNITKINGKIAVKTAHGYMFFSSLQDALNHVKTQKQLKYMRNI